MPVAVKHDAPRLHWWYHPYLSPKMLSGLSSYKYMCHDTSPLNKYIFHPLWNKLVLCLPLWVAPNLLTLIGFVCCFLQFLLLAIYDYNYTASMAGSSRYHAIAA